METLQMIGGLIVSLVILLPMAWFAIGILALPFLLLLERPSNDSGDSSKEKSLIPVSTQLPPVRVGSVFRTRLILYI